MKNKFLTIIVAVLSLILTLGVCVTAFADETSGAETRPYFNWEQSGEAFVLDKTTGVYTGEAHDSVMPRLTSVDGEMLMVKPEYSDDTIKFSYQYVELFDSPLQPSDWFMYFTFRNQDESPVWVSSYGAHLLFYANCMVLKVIFNNETLVDVSVTHDDAYDDNFNFIDNGYHTVEISIDDEQGKVVVLRDKGTEKEVKLEADCNVEYKGKVRCVLDTKGCYSFSLRNSKVNVKDLYFFNSKNTQLDDEISRYEDFKRQEEEENQEENQQPNEPEKKKGCGSVVVSSSVISAFGLTTFGGIVLLKKKEK